MSSNSGSEEDLPVYHFLQQPSRHGSRTYDHNKVKVDHVTLDSSDTEIASSPLLASEPEVVGDVWGAAGVADVMVVSSDSDEDAPYVPLAMRLKQRQEPAINAVRNGKDPPEHPPCYPSRAELSVPTAEESSLPQPWLPPTHTSSTGHSNGYPAKRTVAGQSKTSGESRRRDRGEKETRKKEQEKLKAERKAQLEATKALRPEECIKYIVVVVDPALLQLEGGGPLLTSVQALGCSCAIEKQPLPRSIGWVRRSPSGQLGDVACAPEAHVVMQMTADDFIALVHNYTQEQRHGRMGHGPTLTSWVQDLQARNPERILSLAVVDLEKYYKSQKSQCQKRLREAVLGKEQGAGKRSKKPRVEEPSPDVSRVDVEEAVVHLQLHTSVSVRFLATWKEFSDHIVMTTKAVAEAPFKREREKTGFSFCLESEWAGGQKVDKAGNGLLQAWKRQIQQFNRVSPDMAATILGAYPSPQLLKQAYRRCETDRDRINLLSELLIRRGEGVTSTTRRVGPELSKRLFLLMTSWDPQQTLDSSA